jgi:hypothetical protein
MDLFKILDGTPEPPIVSLATSENMSGDYWLPVPMCEYQKELTDQVVSLHYSDILKYFETDDKEQVLLDSLEVLYLNSQLVSTHPYLLIDHYFPKNLVTRDMPLNLCETSGKFQVLKDVISMLEDRRINIAIAGRSGRLPDLIEALLLGSRCHIKRLHGSNLKIPAKLQSTKNSRAKELTVHIIPSDVPGFSTKLKFDLVISFDITPTTDFLQSLRKSTRAPILRLVSANSIDHIALYFRQFHERGTKDYLVDVTAAIVVLRDQVGILPPDLRPIYSKNLTYLSDWFQDFGHKPWPLPEMSAIRKYGAGDVERSLLTEVHYYQNTEKVMKQKTCYEKKRLNKDYTSNPLKDVNFGILSINSNYADSLTHKLIQDFTKAHSDLQLQMDELNNFEEFESDRKDFTRIDSEKLKEEVDGYRARIEIASEKSVELISKIEETKKKVDQCEEEIVRLSKNEKLLKIKGLKEKIAKEEQRKQSSVTEAEYMSKEISNAEKSIEDSEREISDLKRCIGSNQQKLEDYWIGFQVIEVDNSDLKLLNEKVERLKLQIEDSLTKLQNSKARNDNRRNSPSMK